MNIPTNDHLTSFSRRHEIVTDAERIIIWEDAPSEFRTALLFAAHKTCNIDASTLLDIVCHSLRKQPDGDWSHSYIWNNVQRLVNKCDWFRVYDITEKISKHLADKFSSHHSEFVQEINNCLRELGIGWQLKDDIIIARGEESYESIVATAREEACASGLTIAESEIAEALKDMSRRPSPDLSGAVQHSIAVLESVSRHVTGDPQKTLGKLMKHYKGFLPEAIRQVIGSLWGYASEEARHGREGRTITRFESQLIVGLSASIITYILQKNIDETQSFQEREPWMVI